MIISKKIKALLPIHDLNNVYVVADFDRTLTDENSQTSWAIMCKSKFVPKSYSEERQELFRTYRPIEIDETIDLETKMKAMEDWYEKHISLFTKYQMTEEIFESAASASNIMTFRPGAKEFIEFLHKNKIPLIIISAGVGNFIETFLRLNDCYFDNIYVCSNTVIFKDGIANGVGKNLIHSLNKNEASLPPHILQKLKNRNKVILLGDQVSDLKMVNPKSNRSIINVGFFSFDYDINHLISNFDIVCEQNDNYINLKELLF